MLLRLMKKQTDGSYKVVGFEKHEDGRTWRTIALFAGGKQVSGMAWCMIDEGSKHTPDLFYIPHDRIDRYTGIDLKDGTKVFERDELKCNHFTDYKGRVYYLNHVVLWYNKLAAWSVVSMNHFEKGDFGLDKHGNVQLWVYLKGSVNVSVAGIQGVTNV